MSKNSLPLAIDLDGTLIKSDTVQQSVMDFLRQHPWKFFMIIMWFLKGRAHLKKALSRYVSIDPKTLVYNSEFLTYLRQEHKKGRQLVLATGSDETIAQAIADHLGIFHQVFASDGNTNLISHNKARRLVEYYGERQFVYAGNSRADLAVWQVAAAAILVDTPTRVQKRVNSYGIPQLHHF